MMRESPSIVSSGNQGYINKDNHDNVWIQEPRDHAKMDEAYIQLKERILTGFLDQLPEVLRQYWQVHQELSIEDDLILCRCRLLIPTAMSNSRKSWLTSIWLTNK